MENIALITAIVSLATAFCSLIASVATLLQAFSKKEKNPNPPDTDKDS